jgi:hypothetical protein
MICWSNVRTVSVPSPMKTPFHDWPPSFKLTNGAARSSVGSVTQAAKSRCAPTQSSCSRFFCSASARSYVSPSFFFFFCCFMGSNRTGTTGAAVFVGNALVYDLTTLFSTTIDRSSPQ